MKKSITALFLGSLMVATAARADDVTKAPAWYESMKLNGDMRYRFENIDDETKTTEQQRDRISIHLGVTAKANDEIDVGIQLATSGSDSLGNGDPVSGNQTLGASGSRKSVFFDLGYIDYHPAAAEGLDVIAGKMKSPFIAVDQNIWDGDYNPEGLALKYKTGKDIQLITAADYSWLDERANDSSDGMQYGAQVGVKFKMDDKTYVLVGGSYYGTENLEGGNVLDNQGKGRSFGNSTEKSVSGSTTNTVYANEYGVTEGFAEAGMNVGIPVKIYASYTVNNEADSEDTGYLAGLTLGQAKDPGSFEVGYNYRDIEKDAVLAALSDSDSGGGGTNHKGNKFYAKVQAAKNLQLAATYFMDSKDPDGADSDYNRLQLDATAKF